MQAALSNTNRKKSDHPTLLQRGLSHLQRFITKFNNDWVMSAAAGLAYNLMVAVVPIAIALISVLGLTLGRLDPAAQAQLVASIEHIFPSELATKNILQPAIIALSKSAGILGVIAIISAIFGGSRLFVAIEGSFDIFYQTRPRKVIAQNVMAILMMLVFIALTPLMVFASSVPALILSLAQNSTLNKLPGVAQLMQNGFLLSAAGILGSLIVCWILLENIYLVIPNRKISLKKSWLGAAIGAILLQIFLSLFPLYIAHFMGSYQGDVGFAIIFLVFFYYCAVILLSGAEINAYFAEKIQPLPDNVAVVIYEATTRSGKIATADHDSSNRQENTATENRDTSTEKSPE
jgi:membrane protein